MNTEIILLVIAFVTSLEVSANEPQCTCSKFHYEEQMLEKMVRMEFAVENMKNEMNDAKTSVTKTVEEFSRLKAEHENTLKKKDSIRPAFTARLSAHLTKLGHNQPIIFDNIVTNIGQAYSGTTGVFTAPKDGVYYFVATILSFSGQHVETEIVKNGDSMVRLYSYGKFYDQGTSGVVLQLNASDEVWVRNMGTNGENVHGSNWSTFSGFQI
ncbi:complement C1q and tumor necrosis factor-related protein 9A-like [Mercenaria mercenaria]|uniref:complement C1q and tumor necrosis factor-related protein 9A-like n=1 Tax=Mercenaria mercenaria TaxID=6596 RepID=UPI00234E5F46|nr:complement C1q and tumor necrosis factor-related protein 9A-like [Mercenaria mercenaria]